MSRIILIGATGTIGKAVRRELEQRHEIVSVGRSAGDVRCDICSDESIEQMYKHAGTFHAVVVVAGDVHFDAIGQMSRDKYRIGIESKLLGQVSVVTIGSRYIQDQGSFTLTGGILNRDPIRAGSSASMVNGALEGFVVGAAIEMPRGIRLNLVSPTVLQESMESYASFFRGFVPVPAATVALAYSKSLEGLQTGQIYQVGY